MWGMLMLGAAWNVAEMDQKIKTMLKLVEQDADSFAQRAEMYYTKRPELVKLINEFNRAYRSLAERYDRLRAEIGQSIAKPGHVHKKEIQGFESLLARLGSCDSDPFEDPEQGGRMENDLTSDQASDDDRSAVTSDSEGENPCLDIEILQMELHKLQGQKRRLADRCRFILAENKDVCSRLSQMQATVAKLQEGNDRLSEQLQATSFQMSDREDEVIQLKKEIDFLKGETLAFALQKGEPQREPKASEADRVKPREENIYLAEGPPAASEQNNVVCAALGFHIGQGASLAETSTESRNESRSLEDGLEARHSAEEQRISQLSLEIEELRREISCAAEKNLQQHIALLALSEEKREAIRQLCFAMDMLRDKNQGLQEALRSSRGCRHTSFCPALGRDPSLAL